VYNLSVLSSIPPNAAGLLSPGTEGLLRLPALFSIGVHDIPELERLSGSKANVAQENGEEIASQGWVACTTDEIIKTKTHLYDIVVEMPPTYDAPSSQRIWPTMKTADGARIKASQRDFKRYKMLHWELRKHKQEGANTEQDDDRAALLPREEEEGEDDFNEPFDDSIVEPTTWSRLAYNGFMWWASAGEQHAYTTSERECDRDLLGDLSDYHEGLPTAIIAYFHRSTTLLVNSVNGLIERSDEEDNVDDDSNEGMLIVDEEDISRMGLDTWSEADRAFLGEFVWLGWGRGVEVTGSGLQCCGVRIPGF
jgi:hypothetical protein